MEFKNRKYELNVINEILNSNKFEFLIIYGRRRIGKTELILKATKNKKSLYYFSVGENNLERFYSLCNYFDNNTKKLKKDYEVLIDYLKNEIDVLIIDEFQNLIKEDKNILNLFQYIIDSKLKNSKFKLILLGSSVSMISSKVLSYQSPLYGRKTYSMKLNSINFFDLKLFYPKKNIKELIEIYGFADGIPYYLIKIDKPFWKFIQSELIEKQFLKDEVDFIMKYEFEDSSTYKLILEAIANGKNKLNEIKDFIKVARTDLSPYLRNLIDVDLIKREVPITENINSRKGRYFIKDNFLKFWFKYIYPNQSLIEQRAFNINLIKNDYNTYLGNVFEGICKQYLIRNKIMQFNKIGRWWHKEDEIDIVAFNDKEIIFCECKYKENVKPLEILKKLESKSKKIEHNKNEIFILFAKSFSKKISNYNDKKVYCFDLKDFV